MGNHSIQQWVDWAKYMVISTNFLLPTVTSRGKLHTAGDQQQYLQNNSSISNNIEEHWAGTWLKLKAALPQQPTMQIIAENQERLSIGLHAPWASVLCQQQSEIYSKWWSLNNNRWIKGLKKSLFIQMKLTAVKLGSESKLSLAFFLKLSTLFIQQCSWVLPEWQLPQLHTASSLGRPGNKKPNTQLSSFWRF